jgi:glycosyltransferase involved in cell wall biosynthesis
MRTLHSVLAQRDVELSVVVVDDGGSDETDAAVASLGDSRVLMVRHPWCQGVAAARNSGIAQAESRWVAFVDDDDLWAPEKLRSQLDALAADPEAGWSCTASVTIDAGCRVTGWAEPPRARDVGDLLLRQNVIPGGGSGVLADKDLLVEVGGFDQAFSNLADWDLYVRLGLRSPLVPVFGAHLGYYVHAQGMAQDVDRSMREYRSLKAKYRSERYRRDVECNCEGWCSTWRNWPTTGVGAQPVCACTASWWLGTTAGRRCARSPTA